MQPELAFKAISCTVIGFCLITFLFLLLVSVRKELSGEKLLSGIFHLGLVVIGFCTFVTLMAAHFQARKMILPQTKFQRIDTAYLSQSAGAI